MQLRRGRGEGRSGKEGEEERLGEHGSGAVKEYLGRRRRDASYISRPHVCCTGRDALSRPPWTRGGPGTRYAAALRRSSEHPS